MHDMKDTMRSLTHARDYQGRLIQICIWMEIEQMIDSVN